MSGQSLYLLVAGSVAVSWFSDYRSHYFVGQVYGIWLRGKSDVEKREAIRGLDNWAHMREWKQNLAGKHPDPSLSAKQLREACSWGAGARAAARIAEPYPSPPYPEGSKWTA